VRNSVTSAAVSPLPAIVQPTALTAKADAAELHLVPALIAAAAGWRYGVDHALRG
jgi:hypothetical protein